MASGTRFSLKFSGQRYMFFFFCLFLRSFLTESCSLTLVWFERSLHLTQVSWSTKFSLTVKTDDVTSARGDVDPQGQLRAVQGRMGQAFKFPGPSC